MSYSKHEAPAALVSFVWSVAGLLAIFFAVIISSFFILKYFFPVSADDANLKPVSSTCSEGESKVAVNNYPGIPAVSKGFPDEEYKHGPVLEAVGGNYQCSMICVPKIDQAKAIQDPVNLKIINDFLSGGSVGDKPITLINTAQGKSGGDQFVEMVKAARGTADEAKKQEKLDELKRTVIVDYSKSQCVGYNQSTEGGSVEYAQMKVKDGSEVKIADPNKTNDQAKLAEAQKKAAEEPAPPENGGPESVLPPPSSGPPAPVTAPAAAQEETETIEQCTGKINAYLTRYSDLLNKLKNSTLSDKLKKEKDDDINRYYEIDTQYRAFKKGSDQSLAKCKEIEERATHMSIKLWGEKTDLAQCKKEMREFLEKYAHKNKTTTASLQKLYGDVNSRNWYIKISPWYWVSAKRQLTSCKVALGSIEKYKIGIGATGPLLTDSQLRDQQNNEQRKPASNPVSTENGVPQPGFTKYYASPGIRGTLNRYGSYASLVIDKKGNVFWSALVTFSINSKPENKTIILPVIVESNGKWKFSGSSWIIKKSWSNVDTVFPANSDLSVVHKDVLERVKKAGMIGKIPQL